MLEWFGLDQSSKSDGLTPCGFGQSGINWLHVDHVRVHCTCTRDQVIVDLYVGCCPEWCNKAMWDTMVPTSSIRTHIPLIIKLDAYVVLCIMRNILCYFDISSKPTTITLSPWALFQHIRYVLKWIQYNTLTAGSGHTLCFVVRCCFIILYYITHWQLVLVMPSVL